jgi:exosome complex RNA-binding protein Rrp4
MKEQSIVYVKHNKARFILGKRTEGLRILQEFFTENHNDIKGLSGYIIIKSEEDAQEAIALTFWKSKEDMDSYHSLKNMFFAKITEKIKPFFEQLPVRSKHHLVDMKTM